MKYKYGQVSIVGKPNAGKSSLINALIDEKVSIISSKPQTTRNNILGILNKEDCQIVFVDTPGIHPSKTGLDKYMMKSVRSAMIGVDILIYVIDATKKFTQENEKELISLNERGIPMILAVNKIDKAKFEDVYPLLDRLSKLNVFYEIIPFSATTRKNVDEILKAVLKKLPEMEDESCFMFPRDEYTDKSVKFLVSEIIREATLNYLNEEIPHGIAIVISQFKDDKNICVIDAEIYCEKDSHKSIIIGKGGTMSKNIGSYAREQIEKLLGKKVLLKIWVRVRNDWRNNLNALTDIGYNSDEI